MAFSIFILFFFATILFCKTFLSIMSHKGSEEGIDVSNKAGLAVTASLLLGWTLLQAATPSFLFPFTDFVFGLFPFMIATAALSLYSIKSETIQRFWVYLFISVLSVSFFPKNWLIFQGLIPFYLDRLVTAILWASFISIYSKIDKIRNITPIQTISMSLAFFIFPIFSLSKNGVLAYASPFSYYPIFIAASLLAYMSYKKKNPNISLGKTGAAPLGYLMGLFLIFLTVKGYYFVALIMPIYYYFETIYSLIYRFFTRKNPQPQFLNYFITKMIQKNLNIPGIMPLLFLILMGFAVTPILYNHSPKMMFILTGMFFFYFFYRLFTWRQPKVTYKSLFDNTKEAITSLYSNGKESLKSSENNKKK